MTENTGDVTNLGAVYDSTATVTPARTAIIDGETETTLSYADLSTRVASVANAIEELGVGTADRVALCYPNTARYLVATLAVARAGAVPVPINVELGHEKITYIFEDCSASILLLSADEVVQEAVTPAIESATGIKLVAVDSDTVELSLSGTDVCSLRELAQDADDSHSPAPVSASDPAMQPYTSGSTGRPKGVVLSHGGVSWCTKAFVDHLQLDERERGLVVTPLYHKNAMTGVVKPMLECGGSFVVLEEFESATVIDAIDSYGVTYMTGVPAIYKRLVAEYDQTPDDDLSSLSWVSCGSAAVPKELVTAFETTFDAQLLEVYGLTEGGPVVTHSPRGGTRKTGSSGLALPAVETRIVDPTTGDPVSTGETGELLVSSPGLGTYHNRSDANQDRFECRNGSRYLHTGDLARKDGEEYHFIVGRLDDMMIVGGENLYPAEVEDRLQKHDAVADVAVVSVPHSEKGEAPVAFVVQKQPVTEDDLKQFALETGPAFAHPRRVFFTSRLPLGGTGKIDRESLRERALEAIDDEL
jgi:acyl-CoA synthetase (AMP-forming)/AMP-acid ligase II